MPLKLMESRLVWGLRLFIYSSQVFYKKITSQEIEFDEDLMNLS